MSVSDLPRQELEERLVRAERMVVELEVRLLDAEGDYRWMRDRAERAELVAARLTGDR